jgi:hypothetical protein
MRRRRAGPWSPPRLRTDLERPLEPRPGQRSAGRGSAGRGSPGQPLAGPVKAWLQLAEPERAGSRQAGPVTGGSRQAEPARAGRARTALARTGAAGAARRPGPVLRGSVLAGSVLAGSVLADVAPGGVARQAGSPRPEAPAVRRLASRPNQPSRLRRTPDGPHSEARARTIRAGVPGSRQTPAHQRSMKPSWTGRTAHAG